MRIKKTSIPIYKVRLTLIETSDNDKLIKWFSKLGYDKLEKDRKIYAITVWDYRQIKDKMYRCVYLVFNRKRKLNKLTYGAIAHECTHAADYIFNYIGEEKSEECYAYLVEYLVNIVCKFLNINNEI